MSEEIELTEITAEEEAAMKQRLAMAEEKRTREAVEKIRSYAASLGFVLIAQPQLVPSENGAFVIVAGWGIQMLPK